jgi:hypothetical protein
MEYYDQLAEGAMQRQNIILQLQRQYAGELKIRLKESDELNAEMEREVGDLQKQVNEMESRLGGKKSGSGTSNARK